MMSLSLDEPRPIDSRGRASPPGEASSGELSGEYVYTPLFMGSPSQIQSESYGASPVI